MRSLVQQILVYRASPVDIRTISGLMNTLNEKNRQNIFSWWILQNNDIAFLRNQHDIVPAMQPVCLGEARRRSTPFSTSPGIASCVLTPRDSRRKWRGGDKEEGRKIERQCLEGSWNAPGVPCVRRQHRNTKDCRCTTNKAAYLLGGEGGMLSAKKDTEHVKLGAPLGILLSKLSPDCELAQVTSISHRSRYMNNI